MNRRNFLKSIAATGFYTLTSGCKSLVSPPKPKPNFILIFVDDLGFADVGCYCKEFGNDYYESPNIDKLRNESMKFTNAYANCTVCSPSRASILTGRYPTRSGITNWIGSGNPKNKEYLCPANANKLPLQDITIAEILNAKGYATCHIGKWHLGGKGNLPTDQGFDLNKGGCHWGHPWKGFFSPYKMPAEANLPDGPAGEYLTERENLEALKFIEQAHGQGQPFFLNMSHYTVHRPTQAKQADIDYFQAKAKPTAPQYNKLKPTYAAMIKDLDRAVGNILDKVDELNITDNTIIIFTSDNGGVSMDTSNYPLKGGKCDLTEGGVRVPLLIRWPKVVTPNSLSHTPTIGIDILPTICEIAHAPLPTDRIIDGLSIVPLLKQSGKLERESIFWHYPHYNYDIPATTIRKNNWKLIKRYGGAKEFELFNLEDDISETTDLASKHPDKVKKLHQEMLEWLEQSEAKVPTPNPNYNK